MTFVRDPEVFRDEEKLQRDIYSDLIETSERPDRLHDRRGEDLRTKSTYKVFKVPAGIFILVKLLLSN